MSPTTPSCPELRVTDLRVYPIKSCRGIARQEVVLTSRGLAWDREWMLVRPDGTFVTQREFPALALVETSLTKDALEVRAPGQTPLNVELAPARDRVGCEVVVWGDACAAWDEGPEAAGWFSGYLGTNVRLVRFDPCRRRLSDLTTTDGVEAENAFSDGFPLLLVAEESLEDLNRRVEGPPLSMDRFRPNVVVAGAGPYMEDRVGVWRSGRFEFRLVKACTRCRVTTTDQSTAVVGVEPLRTLAGYRRDERLGGVIFGQNMIVTRGKGGLLHVGMRWAAG